MWEGHSTAAPPLDEDPYDYTLDNLDEPTAAAAEATAEPEAQLASPLAPPPLASVEHDARTSPDPQQVTQHLQQHAEQSIQPRQQTTNIRLGDIHFHSYPNTPTAAQQAIAPYDYHSDRFGLTRSARSRTPTNRRLYRRHGGGTRTPGTPRATAWQGTVPETPPVSRVQHDTTSAAADEQQAAASTQQEQRAGTQAGAESAPSTTLYSSPAASTPGHETQPTQAPAADSGATHADTPLPQLPQKRTHEAMLACTHDLLEPPHHTWDGSPETQYYNQHHCTQLAAAREILQLEGHAADLIGQGVRSRLFRSGPTH